MVFFRRSNKNLSNLSAHEKKEMKLAVMLMIVVFVFLICNIFVVLIKSGSYIKPILVPPYMFFFRRSNKNLSNLSAHEKKEMKLAVMLMIVVVVFLICNILALITNILEVFETEINEVTETSNLLVTVNSSVNFFIYIIFGEKFKRQLWLCLHQRTCCLK